VILKKIHRNYQLKEQPKNNYRPKDGASRTRRATGADFKEHKCRKDHVAGKVHDEKVFGKYSKPLVFLS
jgi:hypothetical protein